jgi:hypothetical protein
MISKPDDLRAYFKAVAAAKLQVSSATILLLPLQKMLLRLLDFTIFKTGGGRPTCCCPCTL